MPELKGNGKTEPEETEQDGRHERERGNEGTGERGFGGDKIRCHQCGMVAVDLGGCFYCPKCDCYIVPKAGAGRTDEGSGRLLGVLCPNCGKVMLNLDDLVWCPECEIALLIPVRVRLVFVKGKGKETGDYLPEAMAIH